MERSWREAKPKWVVEAAENEISTMKRRLALRWPDEARPTPVPFSWGAYDNLTGSPVAGTYYFISYGSYVSKVEIREKNKDESGWKSWRFKEGNSTDFGTNVTRGDLFETERECKLALLWRTCDEAAEKLEKVWNSYVADRGYL